MRLEQLRAFLAIAETGSFQQAARQCNCTQSTISRQIQALEGDLGISLFHRSDRAKLTVGGEKLLPRARKICHEWQVAQAEVTKSCCRKTTRTMRCGDSFCLRPLFTTYFATIL